MSEQKRFSDEELIKFHEQFQQHIKMYSERVKTDDARHQNLLDAQEKNATQLSSLIDNTKEIIDVYKDIKGAAKVGIALQKFFLWIAKWGIFGAAAAGIWEFVVKKIH